MAAIELEDVTRVYDTGAETVRALDDVSVSVERGEFLTIMGPSGSGKSTMLNMLGLLDVPTAGTVQLDGETMNNQSEEDLTKARRQSIGFVFQDFYLVPSLTARENVELPAIFYDDGASNPRARATDLLRRVGLGDRLEHLPNELSGGQKQRVAIARGLINNPAVLLADEPTGNLDRDTSHTILEEFARLTDQENVAIIAVTHDELVTEYADRQIDLVDGVIR